MVPKVRCVTRSAMNTGPLREAFLASLGCWLNSRLVMVVIVMSWSPLAAVVPLLSRRPRHNRCDGLVGLGDRCGSGLGRSRLGIDVVVEPMAFALEQSQYLPVVGLTAAMPFIWTLALWPRWWTWPICFERGGIPGLSQWTLTTLS
jgi:hypothetical protein